MYDTLKMLRPLITPEFKELTPDELALMYKETHDARILATMYYKVYKFSLSIANKFYSISDVDKASLCLEKLDYCMCTYKPEYTFLTYYGRAYKSKLSTMVTLANYQKRKGILVSINELINLGIEDTYDIIDLLLPKNLTERESKLCRLKLDGYTREECAKELGVSSMTISNIEKSMRHKFNYLQN